MSSDRTSYSPRHLLGNTNVPRNTNPLLRATNRRADPDGGSSVPYYADASGKTLSIVYTKDLLGLVTPVQVDVALASNSLASIISTINAEDPDHLEALDQDGFLTLRNKNPGRTHSISIEPWTVPADDAAAVFGFRVNPFPGYISYAGEIASTAGVRTELNPQGTALLGRDEDLTPASLNRGPATLIQLMQELRNELERDVIVYRSVPVTFGTHPISNSYPSVEITDDDLRLPVETLGMEGLISGGDAGRMDPLFSILSDDGMNKELGIDIDADTTNGEYRRATVLGAFYATAATAFNDTLSFATWGTPDGRSIYGSTVPNKDKHPAIAIESFDGNIAYCPGATFETLFVKKNDLVEITDPIVTLPFDHAGWFAVERVIDEEHIAIRTLSTVERVPSAAPTPGEINPAGLGDLRVAVGYFVPASSVWIIADITGTPNAILRVAVGVPLREALAADFALGRTGTWNHLSALLDDHINTVASDRHTSSQIGGFTTGAWANATTSTGTSLVDTINDIIADLATTSGTGGSARLGGGAISIGGVTPNSLSAGTINAQLTELLTTLRDQVNYDGSGSWADGSSLGAQNIEAAIDQIVSDLASDTVADDGAQKIGAQPTPSIGAGTVRSQLLALSEDWGKLGRAQTWTALNIFNHIIEAEGSQTGDINANPVFLTATGPQGGGAAKLLWDIQVASGSHVRLYEYVGALVDSGTSAMAWTVNAFYTTSTNDWAADTAGQQALIYVLTRNAFHIAIKTATGSAWDDTAWGDAYSLTGGGDLVVKTADISGTVIDAAGAIDVAANQDVTVTGTGDFKHPTRHKLLSAMSMTLDNSANWTKSNAYVESGAAAVAWFTPAFDAGDRITTIAFELYGNGSTDITITAYVVAAGVATSIGTTTVNDSATSWLQTNLNVTDTTLAAGESLVVRMDVNASGLRIGNADFSWDRP